MQLTANLRTEHGKRVVRRLRNKGNIPAVIYGPETEPVSITLNRFEVEKAFHKISESMPLKLELNMGDHVETVEVFIKNVQIDKVTDQIVHIDFYRPAKGHTMKISIPIRVVGKAEGVEKGGILEVIHSELPVETLPSAVVEYIEIDVTKLGLGQSIHVRDLKLPQGMKPLLPQQEAVVTVVVPRGLAAEEEVKPAEATAAEPEVIKKGKKEEEVEEEK